VYLPQAHSAPSLAQQVEDLVRVMMIEEERLFVLLCVELVRIDMRVSVRLYIFVFL
jgi:hypothetical protein